MNNFMKKSIVFAVDCWRLIMNVKYNPLRFIPDPVMQTYFMLVLFIMWSAFFGMVVMYHMGFMGYDIVTSIWVHVSILIPIAITNGVFIDAERDGAKWIQEWRKK
jgi:hypothetical protein